MEKINVYDFDKTILPYDSTEAFSLFCLRRHPRAMLGALRAVPYAALMPLRIVTKTRAKEVFYSFLANLEDVDAEVEAFWAENLKNINAWYLAQRRPDDLVISASPEFLLRPAAEALGFRLIASRVDKRSGWTLGLNCHDEEKVRRLREEYPEVEIAEFYSDSLSDTPLARIAERAFIVKGSVLSPWPQESLRG